MLSFKFLLLLSICFYTIKAENKATYEYIFEVKDEYKLPDLEFGLSDLEPFIAESTMYAHYHGHHQGYTNKMNSFLKQWREKDSDVLSKKSPFEILNYLENVPANFMTAITNNVGGYVNHAIYWSIMSGNSDKTIRKPSGKLQDEISDNFESFDKFKEQFTGESMKLFGSGYVWLVVNISDGERLKIVTSINQDSPISQNLFPILVIDIWEHAYYLQHQFKRAEHIEYFWFLVDWQKVENLKNFWKIYLKSHYKEEL